MYSRERSHVQQVAKALPRLQFRFTLTSAAASDAETFGLSMATGRPREKTVVPCNFNVALSALNAATVKPAAETIRPQLGSLPCMAHLTSGELARARAIICESDSDLAFSTVIATTLVAPSPSAAI